MVTELNSAEIGIRICESLLVSYMHRTLVNCLRYHKYDFAIFWFPWNSNFAKIVLEKIKYTNYIKRDITTDKVTNFQVFLFMVCELRSIKRVVMWFLYIIQMPHLYEWSLKLEVNADFLLISNKQYKSRFCCSLCIWNAFKGWK